MTGARQSCPRTPRAHPPYVTRPRAAMVALSFPSPPRPRARALAAAGLALAALAAVNLAMPRCAAEQRHPPGAGPLGLPATARTPRHGVTGAKAWCPLIPARGGSVPLSWVPERASLYTRKRLSLTERGAAWFAESVSLSLLPCHRTRFEPSLLE